MVAQEEWLVEDEGVRLDAWLAGKPSVGSRRRAREAIASGKVEVDGVVVGVSQGGVPVRVGARVRVFWNRAGTGFVAQRAKRDLLSAKLRILHDRDGLVAIAKPAGLLTDAATGKQRREEETARGHLQDWLTTRHEGAWCCHRIDRDTSGVVLFATSQELAAEVRDLFAAHEPERLYHAVLQGEIEGEAGVWEDTLQWNAERLRQYVVARGTPQAHDARASWRVLQRFDGATLLEVSLFTGRRNQIRVQAASRGMPVLGEHQYRFKVPKPPISVPRQALHAARLQLVHPWTGQEVSIEAPWPSDMRRLVGRLTRSGIGLEHEDGNEPL